MRNEDWKIFGFGFFFFWRRKEERSFRSKLWWNEFNKTGGVGKIGVMKYIYRKDWGVGRIP